MLLSLTVAEVRKTPLVWRSLYDMKVTAFPFRTLVLGGAIVAALAASPAAAQISPGPSFGLAPGNAYRNNVAYDPVNQVYLVIVKRPPVTGRFYDRNGVQIGADFVIASEAGYTAWASVAFGGPSNDPTFLITYVIAQGNNPKFGRLVRFGGGSPTVGSPQWILDVGSEWPYAEKAQSIWNGQKFIVGSRVKNAGASFPTFQVNHFDTSGNVSGGVDLGDGLDYYGSPALACATNGICLTVGYLAGIPTGYSGGSYGRRFDGATLSPIGGQFTLSSGSPNEDQGVVYQAHLDRFLAQWFRGGGPGYIDTRIVGTDGSMTPLDLTRGIGPDAGTNSAAYNPLTRTTVLLTKSTGGTLYAIELGDDGYPRDPNNWLVLTLWDGKVLDYLPSIGSNNVSGQWLVTWELQSGGFARIINSAGGSGSCTYSLNPTSSGLIGAGGGSAGFSLIAGSGCGWSAIANQSWIHTSSAGSSNGTINYTVDANAGGARTGSITAGGQTFSVSQVGAACGYTINPTSSPSVPATGSAGLIIVSTASSCSWSATTASTWLHPSGSGSGGGTAGYTVDANPGAARSGTIVVGGQSFTVPQAAFGTQKADLISPAPNSTLTSSSVTFTWTGGTGVSQYWLYVGTTPGAFDLVNRNMGTQLSTVANGLPTSGQTLYVRLHSYLNGWQYNDYTLAALTQTTAQKAQLTSPAPSSTLTSSTVTFQWTGGVGVTRYWLYVGTSPGSFDLVNRDAGSQLSTVASGLPAGGQALYVRLHSNINGAWQYNDYTLTAATLNQLKAQLTSPAPGSTLTSSTVTFQWTGGSGVAQYWLYVGTTPGGFDLANRDMGTQLSTVVSGLPANGSPLYVRLHSHISGSWQFNDYTLTASATGSQKAQLTSPAPGSTLANTTVTFQWTGGSGVARYWLYVGTTPGGFDLANRDMSTQLSTVVNGLPANGSTVYVRLHSHIDGSWQYNDYTLTASSTGQQKAQLTSPAPSSTLTNTTVTFQWTGGSGVTQYWLYVGTTPGAFDIVTWDAGTQLSTVVSGLPANGSTLYVRLLSLINGAWQFNDYTLTASSAGVQKAQLTSPAPSSTLTNTTVTFQWTGGTGVTQYWLYVGTAPGAFDLVNRDMGVQLGTVVNGLPSDGSTLYVRLHSLINGAWQFNDYVLTAVQAEPDTPR